MSHGNVDGPGASWRGSLNPVHVDDGCSTNAIAGRAVDEVRDGDVFPGGDRLQGDGVVFEVLEHDGDILEPKVLDVATRLIQRHAQVLERKRGRKRERENERQRERKVHNVRFVWKAVHHLIPSKR